MEVVLLRLRELHDGRLPAVGEPLVRRAVVPPVEARLVDPLVVLPPEDERVLPPHEALANLQPDVVARATEVVALGVRVEDVERAARLQPLRRAGERRAQELAESRVLHRVVLDGLSVAPVVVHVVGRVGEPEVGPALAAHLRDVLRLRRVAADEEVAAKLIHLARLRDGLLRRLGDGVRLRLAVRPRLAAEEVVQLVVAEGEEREVEARLLQRGELDLQFLLVPVGDLGDLVVRDAQGLLLLRGQVLRDDARHRLPAEPLHREKPRVSLDDDLVPVQHRRVAEAELLDDLRKLPDRALVDARVVFVGDDLRDRHVHHLHPFRFHLQSSCSFSMCFPS